MDIIRSIANDGVTYQQYNMVTTPDMHHPDWDTIDIIRTITKEGATYLQCEVAATTIPDMQHLAHIGLTSDTIHADIQPSPYSIRYYTHKHTSPDNTIMAHVQVDSGANRSITNTKDLLSRYESTTQAYNIYGVGKDEVAVQCTGKGFLPWQSENGDILYIPCYYSEQAADTIISPTDVVLSHKHLYSGWAQFAHVNTGRGHITFYRIDGTNHTSYPLHMDNGLWFHDNIFPTPNNTSTSTEHAVIHRLTNQARYELFHQRCCHCGKRKLDILHKHIQGIKPLKGNAFHLCQSCIYGKQVRRAMTAAHHRLTATTDHPESPPTDWLDLISPVDNADSLHPGDMFHMDFGFPRGHHYSKTDELGRLQTSIDGHRAYLLIIDRKTRYIWITVTKTKQPPCDAVTKFLELHGRRTGHRTIRTDKGGELWGSLQFRNVIHNAGYLLQPTAPDAPFQNGLAERPNRTLGNYMRCMLHAANLGPEFWSYALIHAARVYNMLPHSTTNQTPYYSLTGKHPHVEWLRVFGCRYYAKNTGDRPHKLDYNTSTGVFLGFTGTAKNVYYYDIDTKRIKTSTHGIFDEANITMPQAARSTASQALIDLGYRQDDETKYTNQESQASPIARIQLRTPNATIPTQESPLAVGYDVYSTTHCILPPHEVTKFPLGITIVPPQGSYVQLHSRSGLASKGIVVYAGVIDPDYRGDITVLLYNSTSTTHTINVGDRIAQLIFHNISTPVLLQEDQLDRTGRSDQGFGSTGINASQINRTVELLPYHMPYNIYLSPDPFDDVISIAIQDFGSHDTMGMKLQQCMLRNRPKLIDIMPSQPCSRIKRWRSTIKHGYITQIEEYTINCIDDVKAAISHSRAKQLEYINMEVALDIKPSGIHPVEGIPQLFSDQLHVIQQHLNHIQSGCDTTTTDTPQHPKILHLDLKLRKPLNTQVNDTQATIQQLFLAVQNPILRPLLDVTYDNDSSHLPSSDQHQSLIGPTPHLPQQPPEAVKYTWKQIKHDPEWIQSCYQQLDQYENQDMFDQPQPKPEHATAWPLVWTFIQKPPPDGRKKARCVVDGSKRWRRTVTLGQTYANSLATDSERLFWAIAAKRGLLVVGADVSNAFAEAPAPADTFYIVPDPIFHLWWVNHKHRQPIQTGWVLKVKYALQGHPESPRLWDKHITQILTEHMGYKPLHHERCLYVANLYGHWTMLLRQVDDFAFAVSTEEMGRTIVEDIDKHLRIRIKYLGILQMFNGMDILQTKHYIKIHCATYIQRIIQQHKWYESSPTPYPIPYPADNAYSKNIDTANPPEAPTEQLRLSKHYHMHYRQIIGEIIWPMVKCRPDISFHITKLSQFMANPAEAHYQALRRIGSYLAQTTDTGIYYWRDVPRKDLPEAPLPTTYQEPYSLQEDPVTNSRFITAYADSDWGTCRKTRNAITGVVIMVAGGVVGYKTKFQHAIALSSTEAEWVAACDAGKMILYFRTLLEDLGLSQEDATVMFEDNRGALYMANAQQPSNRTRHIDIKMFALTDWVERDLITLVDIVTSDNCADHMTKALPKVLFYRHTDTLMGRRIPDYVTKHLPQLDQAIISLMVLDAPILRPRGGDKHTDK